MCDSENSNAIVRFLKNAGSHGLHGVELKRLSALPEAVFDHESKYLWDQGQLSGIPEENCCGRGCRFMCVSYMEEERVWRLMGEG
ncbi:hypothetical protein [Pseudoteredinibacter isoporae]|uniref:Uncharacterized protein n=1 Tax=Pseudoteredinibacter isoporae TaxID=570281 RepID=A0A7X0JUN9_9GAMM|nr:hypothetical protein [Pseudoteredinibacter isoporae]MBB6522502.1 hypothetical protein [Pseudoteredinibacter isoporae]NHO88031.1 hypothetical protein [Pseudoteredinibacter isoporae]NIB23638.1 hypothetical protein [Pseudoteredinibacter isoporae]